MDSDPDIDAMSTSDIYGAYSAIYGNTFNFFAVLGSSSKDEARKLMIDAIKNGNSPISNKDLDILKDVPPDALI